MKKIKLLPLLLLTTITSIHSQKLDTTFGDQGSIIFNGFSLTDVVDFSFTQTGEILVLGTQLPSLFDKVYKYDTNGILDSSFGNNGEFIYNRNSNDLKPKNIVTVNNDNFFILSTGLNPDNLQYQMRIDNYLSNTSKNTLFGNDGIYTLEESSASPFHTKGLFIRPNGDIYVPALVENRSGGPTWFFDYFLRLYRITNSGNTTIYTEISNSVYSNAPDIDETLTSSMIGDDIFFTSITKQEVPPQVFYTREINVYDLEFEEKSNLLSESIQDTRNGFTNLWFDKAELYTLKRDRLDYVMNKYLFTGVDEEFGDINLKGSTIFVPNPTTGDIYTISRQSTNILKKYSSDGILDTSFGDNGTFSFAKRSSGYFTKAFIRNNSLFVLYGGALTKIDLEASDLSSNEVIKGLKNQIEITPNPFINKVKISVGTNTKIDNINIYDINSKLIKSFQQPSYLKDEILDLTTLTSGLYFIELKSSEKTILKKLIKK